MQILKPSFLFSILVIFIAISFSFITLQPNYIKIQHLKSTIVSFISTNLRIPEFNRAILNPNRHSAPSNPDSRLPNHCLIWMAPFISGGGYCSEAWSYILALNLYNKNPNFRLSIHQHGDSESYHFWDGLPLSMKTLAYELYQSECRLNESIVIFHSVPGAWNPPLFQTTHCPPENSRFAIGRTMFETDRVNPEHVKRCNAMDMVWVPFEFHFSSFVKSGVDPSKVVKVVQAIDTEFFDPIKYNPIYLSSLGNLVLGSGSRSPFVFLSVFKLEYRKGWDVLLQSYLKEFDLSSRGEGWGRPIVEAMAMSLPVIATNWSGPTDYLTEENSFSLAFDRMSEVIDGLFKGHLWAEPSVDKLKFIMRNVMSNLEGAKSKGKKATENILNKFSPEIVANIVSDQIQRILEKIA